MEEKEAFDGEAMLLAQAEIWKYMYHFADSMALKSAVELRIADIIHTHGSPITLFQIAAGIIDSPSPDLSCLARIMRLLVRRKIFTVTPQSDGGEALYGPTHMSRWLLHGAELSLAPMLMMENDHRALSPWHYLSNCVREGGIAFQKAHGREIWDYCSMNPEFNKIFNDAMGCTARITMKAIVTAYKDGFCGVGSMVDVGGGTGAAMGEIVKVYPHIKGINFDLPHVIATAPEYGGVSHVGVDMFKAIPSADAVFMKYKGRKIRKEVWLAMKQGNDMEAKETLDGWMNERDQMCIKLQKNKPRCLNIC
ncbi:hypothetical protein ACSBR1_012502 [Camellia fascicularis]